MKPEISFTDPETSVTEEDLGQLVDKLVDIADDVAVGKFGEKALRNPTDIELSLEIMFEEPVYIVRCWHQTNSETPAIMQSHDFSFKLSIDGEDGFIDVEDLAKYKITTRETLLLLDLTDELAFRRGLEKGLEILSEEDEDDNDL
ncbi:MAG: hypothetical protein WD061_00145 [Candidatus Saccharimonadales bacterium]